jgi:glutamate decarboxylase
MGLTEQRTHSKHPHKIVAPIHHDPNFEMACHRLPDHGISGSTAYELISSSLLLDGQARLNLATFVTTWMPSLAARLMAETADKNIIDKDEYPVTAEIEARCVNILADLWNSPDSEAATGCSTTGSSEAAMLAGLALKWRWRERMRKAGKPTDRPNLVTGSNVQVCWEKFCRYWDVEPKLVPMEGDRFHLDAEQAVAHCDENTIGVVSVLGSTFDGSYEPVKEIADALDKLESDKGLDIPLHVDAASGGFVAPFLQPEIEWDFRIKRVQSINASGHKYGLVYPGVGWAIWRNKEALPQDLVFDVNYLGGHMPTFSLNFSRPGSEVIAQYYMFTMLGREGYHRVLQTAQDVAVQLSSGIAEMGPYQLLTAYSFPENRQDLSVLRMVIRAGMNHDMAEKLLEQLADQTEFLQSLDAPLPGPDDDKRTAFAH